jgi:ATP/ADP translocase
VTLVMMLLGRSIFQKFGWGTAALITPIMLLATGVAFFSLIIFNGTPTSSREPHPINKIRLALLRPQIRHSLTIPVSVW